MSDDPEADRRLVENERSKLTATYVNGLAIAVFAVGGLAPLVSAIAPRAEATLHTVPGAWRPSPPFAGSPAAH